MPFSNVMAQIWKFQHCERSPMLWFQGSRIVKVGIQRRIARMIFKCSNFPLQFGNQIGKWAVWWNQVICGPDIVELSVRKSYLITYPYILCLAQLFSLFLNTRDSLSGLLSYWNDINPLLPARPTLSPFLKLHNPCTRGVKRSRICQKSIFDYLDSKIDYKSIIFNYFFPL